MSDEPRKLHVGPVERIPLDPDWHPPREIAGEQVLVHMAVTFSPGVGGIRIRCRTLPLPGLVEAALARGEEGPLSPREAHRLMVEAMRALIVAAQDKLASWEASP